jgi:ACR3 family arsenite efflux pump ArsB
MANLRTLLLIGLLTLILPGMVKVDLANFDIKFQTKFLYIGFFQNLPIPAETACKSC